MREIRYSWELWALGQGLGPLDKGKRGTGALRSGRAGYILPGGEGLGVGWRRDRDLWGKGRQGPGPEICFFCLKPSNCQVPYRSMPASLGTLRLSSPLRGQLQPSVASSPRQPFLGLDFTQSLPLLPPKITSRALPPAISLYICQAQLSFLKATLGPSGPDRPPFAVNWPLFCCHLDSRTPYT